MAIDKDPDPPDGADLEMAIRQRLASAHAAFFRLRAELGPDFDDVRTAAEIVVRSQHATVESLSAAMSVDSKRAVDLLRALEELHIIGSGNGLPWRTVLVGHDVAAVFANDDLPNQG